MKRYFHSETIHYTEFLEKNDTSCFHFIGLHPEFAGEKAEHIGGIREEFGNYTHSEIVLMVDLIVRPVNEDVLFLAMPMQVKYSMDAVVIRTEFISAILLL